jgi:carboxyl-terminal processing protease
MSSRKTEIIILIMIVALALASFAGGFLLNELIDRRSGRGLAENAADDFAVFWEAWGKIEESYIGGLPTSRQLTYGAVRGAINVLGDPYTIFIEPVAREQEIESLRGNFGGVGAVLELNENGEIILSPIEGNPAELAGILEGDILIAVDGQPIDRGMSIEEVAELVRGEEGTKVTLTVLHPNASEPEEITIVRAVILLPSVTFEILEEDPTVGYIRLSRFSGESSAEMLGALDELEALGAEKLILDLRQNGGGLLDAAIDVSDQFLDKGPVLYQISKGEKEKIFETSNDTQAGDIPLVILIDNGTASAAEIVAGALQDRERATLIGTNTFGKGSVQIVYDLSDGSSVHVTSARWLTPNRHQIDQQGLSPDILVELTDEAIAEGRDVIMEEALAYLNRVVAK